MKYIQKSNEPQSIIDWKKKFKNKNHREAIYSDLDDSIRRTLRCHLIEEQGGICCYCCNHIVESNSHNEHLRPKGNPEYESKSLDYSNLLASCNGFKDKRENCGHKKQGDFDETLMISPLETDCHEHFKYDSRGRIRPRDEKDKRAAYTIQILNLDHPRLNHAREEAMWAANIMGPLDKEQMNELYQKFSSRDENGRYVPFCNAILYQLEKARNEISKSAI